MGSRVKIYIKSDFSVEEFDLHNESEFVDELLAIDNLTLEKFEDMIYSLETRRHNFDKNWSFHHNRFKFELSNNFFPRNFDNKTPILDNDCVSSLFGWALTQFAWDLVIIFEVNEFSKELYRHTFAVAKFTDRFSMNDGRRLTGKKKFISNFVNRENNKNPQ